MVQIEVLSREFLGVYSSSNYGSGELASRKLNVRNVLAMAGDVLSGTWSNWVHHTGVMEEWLGQHWWTSRAFLLMSTTLLVFAPLISFKRVGKVLPPISCLLISIVAQAKSVKWLCLLYSELEKTRASIWVALKDVKYVLVSHRGEHGSRVELEPENQIGGNESGSRF